jgi:hypothetical protein
MHIIGVGVWAGLLVLVPGSTLDFFYWHSLGKLDPSQRLIDGPRGYTVVRST